MYFFYIPMKPPPGLEQGGAALPDTHRDGSPRFSFASFQLGFLRSPDPSAAAGLGIEQVGMKSTGLTAAEEMMLRCARAHADPHACTHGSP